MNYEDFKLKKSVENTDYPKWSAFVIKQINHIVHKAIVGGENKIFIRTNLRIDLPMENINKIAGPFIEAWAQQTFQAFADDSANPYCLVNIEAEERSLSCPLLSNQKFSISYSQLCYPIKTSYVYAHRCFIF